MRGEIPKSVSKKLAELVSVAHEAALRRALSKLGEHFDRWRGRVSEVLDGKRSISKEQANKLASVFKVTVGLFIWTP